jgi:hypothetical protein
MDNTKTKVLLACGTIGPPLFILAFLIEGATRSDYNPLRHPVSSLSIGEFGWIQAANFIITGMLFLFFAIGLRRVLQSSIGEFWGALLIGLVGIGLIGAGIFTTDPLFGYPTNKALVLAQYSFHGHLHDLFSILVFFCLPAACLVFRRRLIATGERGWAAYSAFTGIAMFVTFVLAGMGFKQFSTLVNLAGVFQRLSIAIGWSWITLIAIHLMKTTAVASEKNRGHVSS